MSECTCPHWPDVGDLSCPVHDKNTIENARRMRLVEAGLPLCDSCERLEARVAALEADVEALKQKAEDDSWAAMGEDL